MERSRKILIGTGIVTLFWIILVAAVVGGVTGYFVANKLQPLLPQTLTTPSGKTIQVTREESAVILVVAKASPTVVSIVAKGIDPFSGQLATESAGTGFIVSSDGVIVTNSHVVDNADSTYTVVTKDKKTYTAKSISRDPVKDLAMLRIAATGLSSLELGDSSAIRVGQTVVAIGNALGKFDNTVTTGVVSGTGRGITASDSFGGRSEALEDLIQTDAAINSGNSGGPLLNLAGEVIGINTAAASNGQNIGFAIPANTVRTVLDNYLKNGRIIRSFLGVGSRVVTKVSSQLNNIPEGALVTTVASSSAAEKAGIKRNDIITELGGQKINEDNSLAKALSTHQVGETVTVKIWRGGDTLTINAVLTEAPQP